MFHSLLEAVRFLTLIPIPFLPPMEMDNYEKNIARSMAWFPFVGLLIGLIACTVGSVFGWLWNDLARAVAVVASIAAVTGGLHLDGLSDTFDAVMSWRPRERKLEIMKDSRIGAMGAIALVVVIFLKVAFIVSAGERWWQAVLVATTLGRWADLYAIFSFPAASEGGLGRNFRDHIRRSDFAFATIQTIAIVAVVVWVNGVREMNGWIDVWMRGGISFTLALVVTHIVARRWTKSLGGLTGDTYGALCEIGETVTLAAISASF
jgi:adenosylcobinamide-GDP ribazoletransferase